MEWEIEANRIMFQLKATYPDWTADDFYKLATEVSMPPNIIKQLSGALFKAFKAAGYIQKTKEFRLSTRNGSTPLPVWKAVLQSEKQTLLN